MKGMLIVVLLCSSYLVGQTEKFEDTTLIYLNYVDPQACDYPHNLAFFHTYEEFEILRYQVEICADSLTATRTFYEPNYDEDSVLREETIRIHFGSSNDFRHITFAEYQLQAFEYPDPETGEYQDQWTIHFARIDYLKEELYYKFHRDPTFAIMELRIPKPAVENIEFLQYLCFFYRNGNNKNTQFKITENE